jgi:hypothetical protein
MSQNTERVVLYIDSRQRVSGTSENFVINLASNISKVQQAEVFSAEIPYTFYGITNNTNCIVWSDSNNNTYNASVDPGNYGITSFILALQSAMNTKMSGFVITYIREFHKIKIQNSTPFRIDLVNAAGTTTLGPKIGLKSTTPTTNTATSIVMPDVINLSGPKYLLIKSQRLTRPKITRPFLNSVQDDVLYKMVVTGSSGDILIEKNTYSNLLKYGVRQTINQIDFQLTDENGALINLNGLDWSLSVNLVIG